MDHLSGEFVIPGIGNDDIPEEERQEIGKKRYVLYRDWEIGHFQASSVDVPGPTFCLGDNFWVEGKRPNMATFLTPRSLLLLEHLGWTKEDMDFFLLPVDDLDKSEKFEHLCWFIAGMTIVNW